MYRFKTYWIFLLIIILFNPGIFCYAQKANIDLQVKSTIGDSTDKRLNNIELIVKKLYQQRVSDEVEFAKLHIERANRIIDWSAMVFTALAIMLGIAGVIGLREFRQLRKTEKNMNEMLQEVKSELKEIKDSKAEIIKQSKIFMEYTYSLNEGIEAYNCGNYLKAKEFLHKALLLKKDDTASLHVIGKCLFRENKREDSIAIFHRILNLEPSNAKAYFGLAINCFRNDNLKCIEYLTKACQINPNFCGAFQLLGRTYLIMENYEESFQNYLKARAIKMQSTTSLLIGVIYVIKGDTGNAEKFIDEAKYLAQREIEQVIKIHWAYLHLAIIEAVRKNADRAKEYIKKAAKYNSSDAIHQEMKGHLQFFIEKNISGNTFKAVLASLAD